MLSSIHFCTIFPSIRILCRQVSYCAYLLHSYIEDHAAVCLILYPLVYIPHKHIAHDGKVFQDTFVSFVTCFQFFCFYGFFLRHAPLRLHSRSMSGQIKNISYPNFILTSKSAFHNLLFFPCHLVVVSLFSIYPISLPVGRAKGFSYTAVLPR